ncbi:MAG: TetR/AcrR family transcriptional regulator, partial [Calditrichaeota bacterium]|nr:TetR/AcrR family transcriptional regulator [Calditrichota bacterium]
MHDTDFSKRQLIKQEAKKLFFRFGLSKTSMDDIARECQLAKPTLYYYFPSKEAIFNEIVVEEATQFMNSVEKQVPTELGSDDKIILFFRALYRDLKIYAEKLTILPSSLYDNYPHGGPIVKKINELLREKLRPLLEEGKRKNILELEDLETTLSALILMTDFLNLKWMQYSPEE